MHVFESASLSEEGTTSVGIVKGRFISKDKGQPKVWKAISAFTESR